MTPMKISEVHYNPCSGAFEARVDIQRNGRTYRYPCQVAGPVTMEPERVNAALVRSAILMSDSGTKLHSWH